MPKEKHIEGIDPKIAVDWGLPESENPVRNTVHRYLKFKDSSVFSPAANFFKKHKCYTFALEGTIDYDNFWDEEERRCFDGFTVGGVRITGRHYYYLNYCQIKLIPTDEKTGRPTSQTKVKSFPRFLDHNYYYLLELEKNLAEGPWKSSAKRGNVVTKGRRKGHTYIISGAIFSYNYTFIPESMNMLAAGEKDHFKVTLDAIHDSINNTNEYTAWGKKKLIAQKMHIKAGFLEQDLNGVYVEKGYRSEIRAISFADNPFKSIGESCTVVAFEEAGKFDGLIKSIGITEPTYREGETMIGIPIVYGTGGQMEKSTKDLHEIFYDPKQFLMQEYDNIYDNNASGTCGYFIDSAWFYPCITKKEYVINGETYPIGTLGVDAQGNSNRRIAYAVIMEERDSRKNNKKAYNDFLTQYPLTPAEAFLKTAGTIFDTITANMRLSEIEAHKERFRNASGVGTIEFDNNSKPYFKSNRDLSPVYEFPLKDCVDKVGSIIIYEHPVQNENGIIKKRYVAGIDSYDNDASGTNSMGSIVLFDRLTSKIVAQFKGRPRAADFYETCRRLLLYYNATANYEKANLGIYNYFDKKGFLHLLCDQPEIVKEMGLSKVTLVGNRRKGTVPVPATIAFGLQEYKAWTESVAYGEPKDSEITNMMKIESESILKETIAWEEVGNYDDISAIIMLFIYIADLAKFKLEENKVALSQYDCSFFKRKLI